MHPDLERFEEDEIDDENHELIFRIHQELVEKLKDYKEREMALRRRLCSFMVDGEEVGENTEMIGKQKVKFKIPLKLKIKNGDIPKAKEILEPAQFKAVFTISANVKKTGLKVLSPKKQRELMGLVSSAPSTPSITVEDLEE